MHVFPFTRLPGMIIRAHNKYNSNNKFMNKFLHSFYKTHFVWYIPWYFSAMSQRSYITTRDKFVMLFSDANKNTQRIANQCKMSPNIIIARCMVGFLGTHCTWAVDPEIKMVFKKKHYLIVALLKVSRFQFQLFSFFRTFNSENKYKVIYGDGNVK